MNIFLRAIWKFWTVKSAEFRFYGPTLINPVTWAYFRKIHSSSVCLFLILRDPLCIVWGTWEKSSEGCVFPYGSLHTQLPHASDAAKHEGAVHFSGWGIMQM